MRRGASAARGGIGPGGPRTPLATRVVRQVLAPLLLTWAVGTSLLLALASYFVAQAYDRSLLDDAHAIAAHVQVRGGQLTLGLTSAELQTLLFDLTESMHLAILDERGRVILGEEGLAMAPVAAGTHHAFSDQMLGSRQVHVVTLRQATPAPFTVVLAQTSSSRNRMLEQLLMMSAVPQLLMLCGLGWWLRRVIQRDLQPLTALEDCVRQRDASDLSPIDASGDSATTPYEVTRLRAAINSLFKRLSASLQAQREFTSNVAHELRTPLAGIRAQVAFALRQEDPRIWREQLQGIARSEARASHHVDQLLALARSNEDPVSLSMVRLRLDELVRDIVLRFLPRADAAQVDLGAVGLEEPVTVWGNMTLIEGLLSNLLDNALRYGAKANARITVSVTRLPGSVALAVTDNGPGIDMAQARHLLERGVQGAGGQALGLGAGLGLSIVRRYAQLLAAAFRLEPSPEGSGLSATVVLWPGEGPAPEMSQEIGETGTIDGSGAPRDRQPA